MKANLARQVTKPGKMLTFPMIMSSLSYLLRGKLLINKGHLPLNNHRIPNDFFGVCVASAQNSAVDDYVVASLKELNLNQVRLDFTYGDLDGFNARFLQRLIDEKFAITLHIVPPIYAAKLMGSDVTKDRDLELATFANFLTTVLTRFGRHILRLEIGNTINRKRWAGYSVKGFLNAWDIAYKLAKQDNITLAGPNVTDFELAYNIGILSILKSKNQLPDIHTNNLFSERISQPERYDHKVFSYRWSTIFKVNLVKKARLLKKISTDFGIAKFMSPAAFWAIYRIERVLASGIEKQADYAARYMLLNAASGAMSQAFWGTFICHREGLINDGLTEAEYPALERIAHYAKVDGRLENFKHYPSFAATKTVIKFIQGGQYHAPIASTEGLEIHHFSNATHDIHAAWCINGRVALLSQIYSVESLANTSLMDRDGNKILSPAASTIVTETPIYLMWPKGSVINTVAKPKLADSLVIYKHIKDLQYYPFNEDGWFGMVLAKDAVEAKLLIEKLHPNSLAVPQKEQALRHARNAIWALPDPRNEARRITVKQPVTMYPHKAYLDRFKPSKAKRSWSGAFELLRRDIDTAKPVAFFEKIGDSTLKQNFYICDFVQADCSAGELMVHFAQGNEEYISANNHKISAENVYLQLASYLNKMHQRGVFFRDLSGGNVLVNILPNQKLHFSLIDTARARFYNHAIYTNQAMADMARICNKLHWAGRERLMGLYLANTGRKFTLRYKLAFYSYDFKVALKRKIGRKGIKKLKTYLKGLLAK